MVRVNRLSATMEPFGSVIGPAAVRATAPALRVAGAAAVPICSGPPTVRLRLAANTGPVIFRRPASINMNVPTCPKPPAVKLPRLEMRLAGLFRTALLALPVSVSAAIVPPPGRSNRQRAKLPQARRDLRQASGPRGGIQSFRRCEVEQTGGAHRSSDSQRSDVVYYNVGAVVCKGTKIRNQIRTV